MERYNVKEETKGNVEESHAPLSRAEEIDFSLLAGKYIEVYSKSTPIIPERGVPITVSNSGRYNIDVRYEWAAPFHAGGWKVAKTMSVLPQETKGMYPPDNAFYYQRIRIYNNTDHTVYGTYIIYL